MDDEASRIPPATQAVLRVLIKDSTVQCFGLELSAVTGLPSGTVHPILARLERLEWIDSAWENADPRQTGRPRRRYYRVNERGLSRARIALADARAPRSRTTDRSRSLGETS
jgi:PadR family transcriptional regulator PadR